MTDEQARETEAYTLSVPTVLWGMQWVKAGAGLRHFAASSPNGGERLAIDPLPHG